MKSKFPLGVVFAAMLFVTDARGTDLFEETEDERHSGTPSPVTKGEVLKDIFLGSAFVLWGVKTLEMGRVDPEKGMRGVGFSKILKSAGAIGVGFLCFYDAGEKIWTLFNQERDGG